MTFYCEFQENLSKIIFLLLILISQVYKDFIKMVKGELLYKNGDIYYGQLKNGQLYGQGIYKFANGSIYEGYFENNEFHGRGKLTDNFNSITIISNFQKGKPTGQGKIIYEDQSVYEGQLRQGVRNGKGRYTYSPKQPEKQYQGQFINDFYEGEGTLIFKNGDFYKGTFKNSLLSGLGEFKNGNTHIIGQFKEGLPHGKAKTSYEGGQKYEGDFQQGKKNGYGVYTYKDGTAYSGKFKNDLRQGNAEIKFADGSFFKGLFNQDDPVNGQYCMQGAVISGKIKNEQFDGFCMIKNIHSQISGNLSEGKKQGIFTMTKVNKRGKQITYKGQFRNNKQNQYSVSFSQRF